MKKTKLIISCMALLLTGCFGSSEEFKTGVVRGTITNSQMKEISGISASRLQPGYLWGHNDSGNPNLLFAFDDTANFTAVYTLEGATAQDWEAMAIGPGPVAGIDYLYVGDIGDNFANRAVKTIYRFAEPTITEGEFSIATSDIDVIKVRYADRPRDAEALMVDPIDGRIYIISKWETRQIVYQIEADVEDGEEVTAQPIATLPPLAGNGLTGQPVVAADISPDGTEILIKTYGQIFLWRRGVNETLADVFKRNPAIVPYTKEPQGEAVTWDSIGDNYFTLSEGSSPKLYYYERR